MNISDYPHRIKKRTELAVFEPVCGVSIRNGPGDGVGSVNRAQADMKLRNHVKMLKI
jgi:hypothetical protein